MTESLNNNIDDEVYDSMYTEYVRLKSFKDWPFDETSSCSASKMAEAGFFHCPTEKEPDLVQCFVCFKELEGWETTDEPWSEHYSHSKVCLFAQLRKPQNQLTIEELYRIEAARKCSKTKRKTALRIQEFKAMSKEVEDFIEEQIESLKSQAVKKTTKN